jgi:hypothetical protein
MKKEKMALDVVNPQAAGIDVGSRSHYVAIGQQDEDVKEFGVYNEDLVALGQWLLDNEVKTVAMESTGTYWQSLFTTLQGVGLEVILCNGEKIELDKKVYALPTVVDVKRSKTDLQIKLISDTVVSAYTVRSSPNLAFTYGNLLWMQVCQVKVTKSIQGFGAPD